MKISIRYGAAILFSVVGVAISLWALWGRSFDQHLSNIQKVQISQQTRLLKQSFDEFSEKTAAGLMQTIETEMVSAEPTDHFQKGQFEAVALLGVNSEGQLKLNWNRSKLEAFDTQSLDSLAKSLDPALFQSNQIHWFFNEALDKRKYLSLFVQLKVKEGQTETRQVALGMLALDTVSPLMTAFNEAGGEVFLINNDGQVISSLDSRYLGTNVDQHPVFKDYQKSSLSQNVLEAETFAELESIGAFERTNTSNVFAMLNQPLNAKGVLSWQSVLQTLFVVLGFLILGFTFNMLAFTKDRLELYHLRQRQENATEPVPPLTQPSRLEQSQIERRMFNKTINAIVGSIRASIYSLIGKTQIIRDRYGDENLIDDMRYIEDELRTVRDILEDLSWLDMNSESLKLDPIGLGEVIQNKMDQQDFRSQIGSIRVDNNVLPGTFVRCKEDDLEFVLETVFEQCKLKRSLDVVGAEVIMNSSNLGGIVRFEIKHYGLSTNSLEVKRLFQVTDYEHINFTLARLLVHSYGGSFKILTKSSETIYQVDLPKGDAPSNDEDFVYEI